MDKYKDLSDEDLETKKNEALDEYGTLSKISDEEITDEQVDRLLELKTIVNEVKAEQSARADAAEERAERIAAAKAGIDDDEEEEEAADEEAAPDADADEEEEDADAEAAKEPILASAGRKRPVARRVASKAKAAVVDDDLEVITPKAVITVAPDVRGYAMGQEVEGIRGLSEVFRARAAGFKSVAGRKGSAEGKISTFGVAKIRRPSVASNVEGITDEDSPQSAYAKVMQLALQARRARGAEGVDAIVAAAYNGWVTPSENFYDLCNWATFSGEFVLPTIPVSRGGLNRTKGIDFADVFNDPDGYFHYTEEEMEARPTKPFRMLDVPTWEEFRLDSIGYGVRAPIPLRQSFPELLDDYMEKSLVAYRKYVNAAVIQKTLAFLGGPINAPEYGGATADLLQNIEMIRAQFIQKYSLADNQVLEFVFPSWVKIVLKADLSRRSRDVSLFQVTDAQIEGWFRARSIRTQYVRDWEGQDLSGDVSDLTLPTSVQFMVYVPGTYVRGGDDIISLDAIYDQQNLEKNEYIAAFFEESLLVADTCGDGALYELGLNPYGLVGAAILGSPAS